MVRCEKGVLEKIVPSVPPESKEKNKVIQNNRAQTDIVLIIKQVENRIEGGTER